MCLYPNENIIIYFVYIPSHHTNKTITWKELTYFLHNTIAPWCFLGELNDIIHDSEKLDGIPIDLKLENEFSL